MPNMHNADTLLKDDHFPGRGRNWKVVIAGAARTPMGGFQGGFADLTAAIWGGMRSGRDGTGPERDTVDGLLYGCGSACGAGTRHGTARRASRRVLGEDVPAHEH